MEDPKFTMEHIRALKASYDRAMQGKEKPSVGEITCPVCELTFTLRIGQVNEVCEHIQMELAKVGSTRVQ